MKIAAQIFLLFVLLGINSLGFIYHHDCEMPCCQKDSEVSCCSVTKDHECEPSFRQCSRSMYIPLPVYPLEIDEFNPSQDFQVNSPETEILSNHDNFYTDFSVANNIAPPLSIQNPPLLI